jgi:hypothetical protein
LFSRIIKGVVVLKSDYRFSSIWGISGVVIGILAFLYNYNHVPALLPGYEVLVAPAMFALSFFSEETYFTPKMVLFLFGQFLGYFSVAFIYRKVIRIIKQSTTNN